MIGILAHAIDGEASEAPMMSQMDEVGSFGAFRRASAEAFATAGVSLFPFMLPSSEADLRDPVVGADVMRTQGSPVAGAFERVRFFKLAWDAIGSEFASRHVQYEKFYAGANFVTRGHAYRTFDWEGSSRMVDGVLGRTVVPGRA